MPERLDRAQKLFEDGFISEAAALLHRKRKHARARGREDELAEIDDLVGQMRAYLKGRERRGFDRLLERGQLPAGPAAEASEPTIGCGPFAALLHPAAVLFLVAAITLVATWVWVGHESCGSEWPSSASLILLILSSTSAGAGSLSLGLRRGGRALRRILVGAAVGVAVGGIWFYVGASVWASIAVGQCWDFEFGF